MRLASTLFLVAILCSCTDFRFAEGLTCSETGQCPPGYFCDTAGAEDICRRDLPGCGDGEVAGEEICDDGNQRSGDGCRADCLKVEACGDNVKDPAEVCDDGDIESGDGCRGDCLKIEVCGDETVDDGEECDDGNDDDTDGCPSSCLTARCGDGHVQDGIDECDDSDDDDTDDCLTTCEIASCGDGFVHAGAEGCDDGNDIDTDGCPGSCEPANCGDGFIEVGAELCDDGNASDFDLCTTSCQSPLVTQVSVGPVHTCVVLGNGRVRCWGDGAQGKLGYGNTLSIGDDEVPATAGDVDVGGAVARVATGPNHTCALLTTGAVRCWGEGWYGKLGYANVDNIGDDEAPSSAGDVDVGGTVVQIVAGGTHTCALLESGAVRCWGTSVNGVLGYGSPMTIGDDEPPSVVGDVPLGGIAVQIAAGSTHMCALLDTGGVRCWGRASYGRLGYGNTNNIGDDETPAMAGDVPLGGPAVRIAAGVYHTCAVMATGAVYCWGEGFNGRLGYGHTDDIGDDETPADAGEVAVGDGTVIDLALGDNHTCVLLDIGVRCWGNNNYGQLGLPNTPQTGDDELPSVLGVVDAGDTVVQLSVGTWHTCALLDRGRVRCWGSDFSGAPLGYGNGQNIGDDETPASAGDIDVFQAAVNVSAGNAHTCTLLGTGEVKCFGHNGNGQLGTVSTTAIGDDEPASSGSIASLGGVVSMISAGLSSHNCGLRQDATVYCWGAGYEGQLGYGDAASIGDDETPESAGPVDIGGQAVQVITGGSFSCALLENRSVRCWGTSYNGQLGYGNLATIGDNELPSSVGPLDLGGDVEELVAGYGHACALMAAGTVRCWGAGGSGRLGHGNELNIGDDETPAAAGDVPLGGVVVKQLAAGKAHTCALLSGGTVRCWGAAQKGQLGYGSTVDLGDDEPASAAADILVGGTVAQIAAGGDTTCALLSTGAVRCWGDSSLGQLGQATTENIGDDESPASAGDLPLGEPATRISVGGQHVCATLVSGNLRCWGAGQYGQLGYGNTGNIGDDETPASVGDVLLF